MERERQAVVLEYSFVCGDSSAQGMTSGEGWEEEGDMVFLVGFVPTTCCLLSFDSAAMGKVSTPFVNRYTTLSHPVSLSSP